METITTSGWDQYELLDSGNGKRLERYGQYILSRPDPQAIWQPHLVKEWEDADAIFENNWKTKPNFPKSWKMTYKNLSFWARLTPFKHTGIFPEQHMQWDWIEKAINNYSSSEQRESRSQNDISSRLYSNNNQPNVLNLFGYTGIASLTAAAAGAKVTHVDASKPAITWTRENQKLSGLSDRPIRWILDDALVFVKREIKRGVRYDGIIMDPPVIGHGPKGEKWDFLEDFPELLRACSQVLTEKPLFMLVNAYAISASSIMLGNMLSDVFKDTGAVEFGELAIKEKSRNRLLSTGIFARWASR